MPLPPLYKVFRTPNHTYVYDGGTNRIVRIKPLVSRVLELRQAADTTAHSLDEEHLRHCLEQECGGHLDDIKAAMTQYQELKRQGLFSAPDTRRFLGAAHAHDVLRAPKLGQLILEVTEQCNLRCRYCAYSEWYPKTRGYSDQRMPWETAKKAIDYFIANCSDDLPAVTFYGGEPLLALDCIEQCCLYARDIASARSLRFQLTTNGAHA